MNYIDELSKANKNLTFYKLIVKNYKLSWKLILTILSILTAIILISALWLLHKKIILSLLLFVAAFIFATIAVRYSWRKTQLVIENKYKFCLENKTNWDTYTISNIRNYVFKNSIKNKELLSNKNILFIIDSISKNKSRYNYKFLKWITSTFIKIIVGAAIGLFTYLKSWEIWILISLSFILIVFVIFLFEMLVVKEIMEFKNSPSKRLISILENTFIDNNINQSTKFN